MYTCTISIMKTLSILSRKGGVGKTTLAIHLAVCASQKRKETVLLDLDPQASASDWGDSREAEEPVIMSCQSARLQQTLGKAADHGAELAIIDTAPHAEAASLTAARLSDLVLIPCKPAILDIRAIGTPSILFNWPRLMQLLCSIQCPLRGASLRRLKMRLRDLVWRSVPG